MAKSFQKLLEISTMPFSIVISFSLSTFYLSLEQVHLLNFLTSLSLFSNELFMTSLDNFFTAAGSINKARVPERV